MIYQNITEVIGHTPLVRMAHIEQENGCQGHILAKLECMEPAGSAKDRVALSMVLDAEEKGLLKAGSTIIEPTSGNTGIGLASVAAARGYQVILTMPDSMSMERRALLAAYGAQLVLTPGAQGMNGAVERAQQLAQEIPGSFLAGQFTNPANPAAHMAATGPEIWQDAEGQVDAFVAGVGTGGTVTGVGRYLKQQRPEIYVAAVEPDASPLLSGGQAGPHKLQGMGANFIPEVLDRTVYDEVVRVTNEEAFAMGRAIARKEGVLVGISSGAAMCAAVQLARRPEFAGKNVVVLLPDSGERYLSTGMFD